MLGILSWNWQIYLIFKSIKEPMQKLLQQIHSPTLLILNIAKTNSQNPR